MEGLNMTELRNKNPNQFDYKTYASLARNNPPEAQKYRESFESIESKAEPMPIPEVVQQPVEVKPSPTIIIKDEDKTELRKIYQEKTGKKAFG
jgi:hypothetical protein